mgnify:CR=1 FL=1
MNVELLEKNSSESIGDYTYRTVRKNIIDLNLKPGEAITENEIANILNISRTPIRETFAKLVREELVEIYPQKGTFVSLIDLERVEEAKFMRLNLERAAMKLACKDFPDDVLFDLESNFNQQEFCLSKKNYILIFDLDNEMHRLIFKGCSKERVWSSIHYLNGDFDRLRVLRLSSNLDWNKIISHHRNIIKAIKEKNCELGIKTMEEHLTLVDSDKKELKGKYPEYFR